MTIVSGPPEEVRCQPCRVAAVMPVHNRRQLTLQCLESLYAADLGGIDLEVIVVDDGSRDGTSAAVAERFPQVRLLQGDGNLWYAGGMNKGMAAALALQPDFVLGANDDSLFDRRFLQLLARRAQLSPGVVAPLLSTWDEPDAAFQCDPRWRTWGGGWSWPHGLRADAFEGRAVEVEFLPGNCVLIPREAIEQVGFMNTRLFPHWGDAEYFPRLRRAGWPLILETSARVWIKPNGSGGPPLRKMGLRRAARELFLDRYSSHNLLNELLADFYGAPNKAAGVSAFVVAQVRRGARLLWRREP